MSGIIFITQHTLAKEDKPYPHFNVKSPSAYEIIGGEIYLLIILQ